MSIFFGILLTLIVLIIVVMIHEIGHFLTARITGMKVEEFGIGIPPRARRLFTDTRGTEYTLNWLPIGGFVRIFGEDARTDVKQKDTFVSKNVFSRVLVLSAGVLMNFLLAWVIFSVLFQRGVTPMILDTPVESKIFVGLNTALDRGYVSHEGIVVYPLSGSIAAGANIQSGAIINQIIVPDMKSPVTPKNVQQVIELIQKEKILTFEMKNQDGNLERISLSPRDGKVGMALSYHNLILHTGSIIRYTGIDAFFAGGRETIDTIHLTFAFLSRTVMGLLAPGGSYEHEQAKSSLAGPIGLGSSFISLVQGGTSMEMILIIVALLSINLGVINILPFPALDGGRIITTVTATIFSFFPNGRKYFQVFEGYLHTFGFILLLILMLYVAGLDISRIF